MSENEALHGPQTVERRAVLASLGAAMSGLSGCASVGDGPLAGTETRDGSSPVPAQSTGAGGQPAPAMTEQTERASGEWPIVGIDVTPNSLNPLTGSGSIITDTLYTRGTTLHPETRAFTPWAFEDWTLDPGNIGTSSPTLVGVLRDDLTFSDGTPITAEDAQFTVEFIKEQEVAGGSVGASQFKHVETVQVDSPTGRRVSYFFSRPDNGWFTFVLGQLLLPKHVWRQVADYTRYSPRLEPGVWSAPVRSPLRTTLGGTGSN